MNSFAYGLLKDIDAVKNSILYPYTNGTAEGLNNKLKTLKRGRYGRAGNKLLEIKMKTSMTGIGCTKFDEEPNLGSIIREVDFIL